MKYIVPIAVFGILLLHWSGGIPQASVGGSMTIGFAILAAVAAVGIHEAWTHKRGVLGWIVSIVVAFVGALVTVELVELVMVMILMFVKLDGSLAAAGPPLMDIALAGMMVVTLLGSWAALWIVNRWR
ncbi:MAG: hypothetical protein ABL907_08125 [Hyphomicrobium sp.]